MSRPAALAIAAAALWLLLVPAAGRAAGPSVGGWAYNGVFDGHVRYVAVPFGQSTVVERLFAPGAQIDYYTELHRPLGVPMVALDGTGGGLSRDGRTLVLSEQLAGFRRPRSTFYVLNANSLGIRRVLHLRGDFAFDAMSPDAGTIYLIQLDPRDPTRYAVRALNAATGRLVRKPVVDPREPDEAMRGYPQARATSPDGRFVYTLYSGGKETFIHALDTTGRTAACIDIPRIPGQEPMALRLDGRRLTVLVNDLPASYVDTATRRVSAPAPAAAPKPAAADRQSGGGDGEPPLWVLLAGAAALALSGAAALGRRRRAGAVRP
ncbi:MAG TPA: hypothetical protein VGF74_07555 [Thermoleophilaceae bacterium]